ncbi:hypothetical protein CHUAL_013736 [Chamberlinius hualienensis]
MTRMYLNVNGGSGYAMEDISCTTPDIINSLMTISSAQSLPQNCHQQISSNNKDCSNALNSYEAGQYCDISPVHQQQQSVVEQKLPKTFDEDYEHSLSMSNHHYCANASSPSNSESYGSPCASPSSTPSIQATRTHLIKESLKVTIQSKRLANGQHLPSVETRTGFYDELTPEDEDRRRRRRERNKVAATKCRNKKKERTIHLMMESENLEQTNLTLRDEIQRLEVEKQRLLDMLSYHMPACSMQSINQGIYYNSVNNNNSLSIMGQ